MAPPRVLVLLLALLPCCRTAMAQEAPRPLEVALTFDDLPVHGSLPPGETRLEVAQKILKTLQQEQLPPVYGMVNGVHTQDEPATMEVLKAWRDAGQPLGSHTWSHPDLEKVTAEAFEADIAKNEPLLEKLEPHGDWHWFRYPYLREGETLEKQQAVRQYLAAHGYRIAEVSLDFEDYLWNEPYARCMAKGDTAAIQYLHDSYLQTADDYFTLFRYITHRLYGHDIPYVLLLHIGAFDAQTLPDLLQLLRSRGYGFVSLPQAEQDPAYAEDPHAGVPTGGTLQELIASARKMKLPPNSKPYAKLDALCR